MRFKSLMVLSLCLSGVCAAPGFAKSAHDFANKDVLNGGEASGGGEICELYEDLIGFSIAELVRGLEQDVAFRTFVGLTPEQVARVKTEYGKLVKAKVEGRSLIAVLPKADLKFGKDDKNCLNSRSAGSIACSLEDIKQLNSGEFLALVAGHEIFSLAELEGNLDYSHSGRLRAFTGPEGLVALTTRLNAGPAATAGAVAASAAPAASPAKGRVVHRGRLNGFVPPVKEGSPLRLVFNTQGQSCKGYVVAYYIPKHGNVVPEPRYVGFGNAGVKEVNLIMPAEKDARRVQISSFTDCDVNLHAFDSEGEIFSKLFEANGMAAAFASKHGDFISGDTRGDLFEHLGPKFFNSNVTALILEQ